MAFTGYLSNLLHVVYMELKFINGQWREQWLNNSQRPKDSGAPQAKRSAAAMLKINDVLVQTNNACKTFFCWEA
jgi:hypothetical protein